jgi:hypothetical protein
MDYVNLTKYERQSDFKRSGPHLYINSLIRCQISRWSGTAVSTSSSAALVVAKQGSVGTWTRKTLVQLGTCADTSYHAGVTTQPKPQMMLRTCTMCASILLKGSCETDRSPQRLNERDKENLHIVIGSILVLKQGAPQSAFHSLILLTDIYNRAELVRWVCESLRPFAIVKDRGFLSLMKTGRPEYYLPSPETVSRDVKQVFARTRSRVSKMLKVR